MKKRLALLIVVALLAIFATVNAVSAQEVEPTPVYVVNEITLSAPPAPSSPQGVTVSSVKDTSAFVSWQPVAGAESYVVYLSGSRFTGTNAPGAYLTNLTPNTTYEVGVSAANKGGESPVSDTVTFTTLPLVPPAPSKPVLLSVTGNTARVQWQPVQQFYAVSSYRVYVDGRFMAEVEAGEGLQSVKLVNLPAGTHEVCISAVNANNEGMVSEPMRFSIGVAPAPTGLTLYNRTSDSFYFTFNKVAGAQKYLVYLNGEEVMETEKDSFCICNLQNNTEYEVSVAAVMENGDISGRAESIKTSTLPALYEISKEYYLKMPFGYINDVLPIFLVLVVVGGVFAIAGNAKIAIRSLRKIRL